MGFSRFVCAALFLTGCPPADPPEPDPHTWTEAFDAASVGWLLNVWGPSADDLYAVGGEPNAGAVVHFDGAAWTELELGLDVPLLNWAHGFGPNDVWIVGNRGTILHFDGRAWEQHRPDPPTTQDLWGVWGASPDDLWAVGGNGRSEGQATIYRYDGTTWTPLVVPALERANVWAFFKVWGTAADNVWIVGQRGIILQWNGTELVEHGAGTGDDLISLWGTGPDRMAAVGGRGNGVVATWDGTAWRSASLSPLPGMNGVFMRQPNVIHAVGQLGTTLTIDFDSLAAEETYVDTSDALHAVFGDGSGRLVTVGGNLASVAGPYRGIAYERELGDAE